MNALHTLMSGLDSWFWLNVAWHGLLLSSIGWLGVRFLTRDARVRALACFLGLIVACIAPWFMQSRSQPVRPSDSAPELAQTWIPEWKITLASVDLPAMAPDTSTGSEIRSSLWSGINVFSWAWMLWVLGVALGVCWQLVLLGQHVAWRWKLCPLLAEEVSALPPELSLDEIRVFQGRGSPCVTGILRPVVAVPADAASTYSTRQWRWVMAHEREHLKGQDPLIHVLLGWVRAVWWWNPFVHALAIQWEQAREEVCDAAASSSKETQADYASFLVDVAAQGTLRNRDLMMAKSKPARRLKQRLHALLSGRTVSSRHAPATLMTLAGLVVVVCAVAQRTGFAQEKGAPPSRANGLVTDMIVPISPGKNTRNETIGVETEKGHGLIGYSTFTASPEVAAEHVPRVLFNARFVEADRSLGKHGAILTGTEYEAMIPQISQRQGIDIATAPSVTTLQSQPATVEVVKHQKSDPETRKFVGVKLKLEPEPAGQKIKLRVSTAVACPPASRPWPAEAPKTNAEWDEVKISQAVQEGSLAPKEVLVLELGEIRAGRHMTLFVQADAVRYDGKEAQGFDDNIDPKEVKQAIEGEAGRAAPMSFLAFEAEVIVPRGKARPYAVPPGISFFPSEPPAEADAPEPGLRFVRTINNLQFQDLLQQFNDMKEAESDLPAEKKSVKLRAVNPEYRVAEWQSSRFSLNEGPRKVRITVRGEPKQDPGTIEVSWNRSVEGSTEMSGIQFGMHERQLALFRRLHKVDQRGLHYQILLLSARLEESREE